MSDAAGHQSNAPRAPTIVGCFVRICLVKWSLKHRGLAKTVALCVRQRRSAVRSIGDIGDELAQAIVHRIAVAAALYPGRARCLEQSLVLIDALRERGVAAELRLGVKPYRFQSHAWVEANGIAVNEITERIRTYAILPSITV